MTILIDMNNISGSSHSSAAPYSEPLPPSPPYPAGARRNIQSAPPGGVTVAQLLADRVARALLSRERVELKSD